MYDGDRLLCELDENGSVTATLSWGAAGLFAYDGTQYQFDPQGSVVARVSAGDQILTTHWYDAHGTEQTTPSTEPFGYKGQWGYYTDRETGLILCTHRYLDPESGRWLARDPVGVAGGVNTYSYVANRPPNASDPAGLVFGAFIPIAFSAIPTCESPSLPPPPGWVPPDDGPSVEYGIGLMLGFAMQATAEMFGDGFDPGNPSDIEDGDEILQAQIYSEIAETQASIAGAVARRIDTRSYTGPSTAHGGIRNSRRFWRDYRDSGQGDLSEENLRRIRRNQSPVVDDVWRHNHPEAPGKPGEVIEHHHEGQGPFAAPLPQSEHRLGENMRKNHP